ncbi:MAG: hypothetical protein K2O16_18910 [Lachnospiraceae bacterium]|nr:hypothetical protein [Lachnospiraceae bacterium]
MNRNRKLLTCVLAMCLVLFAGCGQKLGAEFSEEVNMLEGAELSVDESLVTPTGLTYSISNQSGRDLNYGQDYSLLKEKDGKWYLVEPERPVAVTMELLWVPAGSTDTMEISWESSYGKLSGGHYRLLKNFSDNEKGYYLAGDFHVK